MGNVSQIKFPLGLNKYDIYFLERRTSLQKSRLVPLLEEKRDFYLIMERVCDYPLSKRQTKNLSFKFLVVLLVFKYSRNQKLSSDHKIFIARTVFNNYNKIISGEIRVPEFSPSGKPSSGLAQIIFIMLGLFYDYFESFIGPNDVEDLVEVNTNYMIKGFSELDIEDVPTMIENGLCVLNKIKDKDWLQEIGNKIKK